jgi:restriction system protein
MAEVTRRRTGELLRKLFEILLSHPEGLQARIALNELRSQIKLTEYEKGTYPSGGNRFDNIVRFATVDCLKAGWFTKNKGRWSITAEGKTAFDKYQDPEVFYKCAVKLYWEWRSNQPDSESQTEEESADSTSIKAAIVTFEEAEEQAWHEIEQYLQGMNPYDFQDLVASLLHAMGYYVSWIAPPGKDGGIDILAWADPLGTRPPRIKVQVRRRNQSVNVDGLRSFMALLGDDDVGIFVSTGGFTKDAEEEARTQEKRKVTLLDAERLFDLWVEYYQRLEDSARSHLPLRPIHFLAPLA